MRALRFQSSRAIRHVPNSEQSSKAYRIHVLENAVEHVVRRLDSSRPVRQLVQGVQLVISASTAGQEEDQQNHMLVEAQVRVDIERFPELSGHFPNQPVFPAVRVLEAFAHLGAVLVAHHHEITKLTETRGWTLPDIETATTRACQSVASLNLQCSAVRKARFRQMVSPPSILHVSCGLLSNGPHDCSPECNNVGFSRTYMMWGEARLPHRGLAAEAEFGIDRYDPDQ
ncbi:3-hydroxyacyl-acyl-carrier-protein dehydratase FabZ [Porphyridium purpureum]|uniref:3-hydroxyacyl-acyl-carrier-protein dehydratase FabZ n=1 Tax=Porphyridium purpureum TaxID=35688 RepID=A0A5J4YSU8_PORPP|nr:3-hydroxyacyl-acyl-carrier-protein dehydratase FabZ [Porphyridium purpureum]|eukprot:POR5545..scf229_5